MYIDAKTNQTLMEWHTDGKDGYLSKISDGVTNYFDRYMARTPWSSVVVQGQTIYAYCAGESIELYESSFKTLNI